MHNWGYFRIMMPNDHGVLAQHLLAFELHKPDFRLGHLWKNMAQKMICLADSHEPLDPYIEMDEVNNVMLVHRDWTPAYEHIRALLTDEQFPSG